MSSLVGVSDELHEALYEALTGDATITTLVGSRVHQNVPQPTAFPYIQLGETFEQRAGTLGSDGRTVLVWIHVWSQYRGDAQAWSILKRIGELLNHTDLVVDGAVVESIVVESAEVTRDPDGVTRHGRADVRVRLGSS